MSRELAYHQELAASFYQSVIRYARHNREGKAAEMLELALEHEAKADQIRGLMSSRSTAKLVNLRDGKQWGKDSDDVVTLHVTVTPGGDGTIHRPTMRPIVNKPPVDKLASAAPLGLSPLTNCTAPKSQLARRGSKGITPKNKKDVRSAVALLENTFGFNRLTLFTGTLPCRSIRQLALVAAEWDRVLDVFIKSLHRELEKAGLPTDYVSVSELQVRGALHLHLLCVGRHPWSTWAISTQRWDEMWAAAVSVVLGEAAAGLNFMSACRVEKPRKSVVRELSKYLSKGSKSQIRHLQTVLFNQCENAGIEPVDLLPRSWVSISKPLKSAIIAATQYASFEVKKSELDWYELENLVRKSGKCISKPKAAGGGPLTRVNKTEAGYPVALSTRLASPDINVLLDALSCLGTTQGDSVSKIA